MEVAYTEEGNSFVVWGNALSASLLCRRPGARTIFPLIVHERTLICAAGAHMELASCASRNQDPGRGNSVGRQLALSGQSLVLRTNRRRG